jgi:hypothetical protein
VSQQALSNRHQVDELAEVRREIRILREREAKLRAQLLAGECGLIGVDYLARIVTQHQVRLDAQSLRKHYGAAALKPFTTERTVKQIWLGQRADSNELEQSSDERAQ